MGTKRSWHCMAGAMSVSDYIILCDAVLILCLQKTRNNLFHIRSNNVYLCLRLSIPGCAACHLQQPNCATSRTGNHACAFVSETQPIHSVL